MSEPMSAGEIEDVLSSIRRLVSEELRPIPRTARVEPKVEPKLMLTPALRVVPQVARVVDPVPQASPVAEDVAPDHDWEEAESWPEAELQTPPAPMATWVGDADDEGDVTRIDGFVFQSRKAAAKQVPDVSTAPVAEVMPEVPMYHGEVLDPDEEMANLTDAWAQEGPAEEDDEISYPAYAEEIVEKVDTAWVDQAEAEVVAALSAQAEDPGDAAGIAPDMADAAAPIDQTALRDMVRDLIREELQGSLGERITRNVRKLVRVEVARALSLHDFE